MTEIVSFGIITLWIGISCLILMALLQSITLGIIAVILVVISIVFIIYEMALPIKKKLPLQNFSSVEEIQ